MKRLSSRSSDRYCEAYTSLAAIGADGEGSAIAESDRCKGGWLTMDKAEAPKGEEKEKRSRSEASGRQVSQAKREAAVRGETEAVAEVCR